MEPTFAEIVAGTVAIGGLAGGGMKFMFDRVSKRQTALEAKQEVERSRIETERVRHETKIETERQRWEALMNDQIADMRREIRFQEAQISHLRLISDAYLRHIAALEGLMRHAGITIPEFRPPDFKAPEGAV